MNKNICERETTMGRKVYVLHKDATKRDALEASYLTLVDLANGRWVPGNTYGICGVLDDAVKSAHIEEYLNREGSTNDEFNQFRQALRVRRAAFDHVGALMVEWPKSSGNRVYPVPAPDGVDVSCTQIYYDDIGDARKWVGTEYAALRWELVAYLIERLFEEVYGGK